MVARSYDALGVTRQRDSVQSVTSVNLGKASRSWKAEDNGGIGHQGPVEKVTKEKREEMQAIVSSCCLPEST